MAPFGAVEADRYDHSLHSGTSFIGCGVDLIHVADLVGFELQPGLEIAFDVKGVFRVGVSGVLVVGVLGDVVLVDKNGRTPRSCKMHLPPSMTASSSWLISSFPSF